MGWGGRQRAGRGMASEFTTSQRRVAAEGLGRLSALGVRQFNACLGEGVRFAHAGPIGAAAMAAWIATLPHEANSGDVYASLEPKRLAINQPQP